MVLNGSASTYYLGFDALTHSELHVAGTNPQNVAQRWVDYLEVAGEMVGQVTTNKPAPGGTATTSQTFFSLDHLGSVQAISNATTRTTGASTAQSYDAWGARRYANATPDPNLAICGGGSCEPRGYIGQEELDQIGLLNLNRRLYDPHIGRFLQADPIARGYFADPQQLNRYAYARNRPLSSSDPTGFSSENDSDSSDSHAGSISGGGGLSDGGYDPNNHTPTLYPGQNPPQPGTPNLTQGAYALGPGTGYMFASASRGAPGYSNQVPGYSLNTLNNFYFR